MAKIKSTTLRLPEALYDAVRTLASGSNESINSFIVESVAEKLRRWDEQLLFDSFTLLGSDASEADVEFALDAQREVLEISE